VTSLEPSLSPRQPLATGTRVKLDDNATFLDRSFLVGGVPWRLLRLTGTSRAVAQRWQYGDVVRPGEEQFARTLIRQGFLHPIYRAEHDIEDVDVIVPVVDDVSGLERLLGQLRGLHVTVVDDGSAMPVPIEECASRFGVQFVRMEKNVGPGAARNAGVASTNRPFLCFIDVDVDMSNSTDVLAHVRAQFHDDALGACAPRVRGAEGSTARDHFEQRFCPLDMGPRSSIVMPAGPVSYVPTACLMVRRDAFGVGFDESLRLGEDVDFVWRLHDHDWLVRYLADVEVTHQARASWRQWWRQRIGYGASSSALAQRHGDRLAPVRVDPWTLIAWTSVVLRKPLVGVRIARAARDQLRERIRDHADDPEAVANQVLSRTMLRSGLPLSRGIVRTYGLVLLAASLHPKLRRPALAIFVLGTAWRWRDERVHVADVPLALADDAAYGVGVMKGAWRTRSFTALRPRLTKSSLSIRDVLGVGQVLGSMRLLAPRSSRRHRFDFERGSHEP